MDILEQRVNRIETVLNAIGIPLAEWLSPQQASEILCVSRAYLMKEIEAAEYANSTNQQYDIKHGIHYRKTGSNWQVNVSAMNDILNTRPELRPVLN